MLCHFVYFFIILLINKLSCSSKFESHNEQLRQEYQQQLEQNQDQQQEQEQKQQQFQQEQEQQQQQEQEQEQMDNNQLHTKNKQQQQYKQDVLQLDINQLSAIKKQIGKWNIVRFGFGITNTTQTLYQVIQTESDNYLRVYYPKGSFNPSNRPSGGLGFYSAPSSIFPTSHAILQYQIYFDDKFEPVKGGKLPGLYIGQPGESSGGKHARDRASVRLMWKKDMGNRNIAAEAYVYGSDRQNQEFQNIPNLHKNQIYGNSLWRGILKFRRGIWNKITVQVRVNTFKKNQDEIESVSDGFLAVTVNQQKCSFDKLIYVDEKAQIGGIMFSTFFGGSNDSWATPIDTYINFKNFAVRKLSK